MSEYTSYLSDACARMMREILAEMQNHNYDSVNFPTLLYGILNASNDDGKNVLTEYFESKHADPTDVEDYLAIMFTDQTTYLEDAYKKEQSEKSSKDSSSTDAMSESKPTAMQEIKKMIENIKTVITFTDLHGDQIQLPVDELVFEIMEEALTSFEQYTLYIIQPMYFLPAMFKVKNKKFKEFLDDIDLNVSDAKKYFVPENIFQLSIIPLALSSFLSILNDKVDITKPCEILMRDKECDKLWNIMLKKNKRNAVIIGEPGVGKSALIEKITYDIKKGTSPSYFKDFNVISLDVNSLIAGTRYRGDSEERISELIKFLKKNSNVILFIDEVHTILGAGSCFAGEMDLANALKPILARGDTIVIGATTIDEYEMYFKSDAALSRRFEKVEVEEPLSYEVYPMIKNKLDALSDFHGVTISEELVEYAILIANCFAFDKQNPDKTLDLIDRAMVTAKRSRKKYVDKKSILHNFDIFFEDWDNMSNKSKRATAYHEAGHYIVGKSSPYLTNRKYLAISIMPAEDYLGVTVHEDDNHNVPFRDMNYYIDEIAVCLAGRVAEKLFTKTYSSGASADLKKATKIAYSVVAELGLVEDDEHFRNRVYIEFDEGTMISEKTTNFINDEVTALIARAYKRAEELITQNQDILRAIVTALLKKYIMSEAQLDTIWKDTLSNREDSKTLTKA